MKKTRVAAMVALWTMPLLAYADSAYDAVQQGNILYQEQHYEEAAQQYATAATQLPGKAEIQFNQGNTAYKQQDYANALNYFTQALHTADPVLESRTQYNLGNVKYQQALQALSNPKDAIPHVQSAMTYYRDSLDADPQQPEARYNLELAHRLLRQLQQQQQQDKSQNPDNPKQAPQDQPKDAQDDQQQPQNQPEQNPQEAQQKESSPDSQNQQTEPSDPDQAASPTDPEQNESQPSPQSAQQLTPEEAEQMLETIRERAQQAERARQQRRRAEWRGTRVDKDW
jgi:Ca-activated chloride channel family protein